MNGATSGARVLLLDGPTGTELERRGLPLPPPAWSARAVAERPELLAAIHADYAAAGADVHTACTFRTTATALAGTPLAHRWEELCTQAVRLCRAGAGPRARVAGSIAPLADCFSPRLTPDDAVLRREHRALAERLAAAGCDLLLVETMPTLRELRAATAAASATGLPTWAAVTCGPDGSFFDDEGLAEARAAAADAGAAAFLVNCSSLARTREALLGRAWGRARPAGLLLGAYANDMSAAGAVPEPEVFAAEVAGWTALGLDIVGSCCGTGPAHTAALRAALDGLAGP
jgi:S-methylmethionine-dependent homocysteine/selenocysteine methylase